MPGDNNDIVAAIAEAASATGREGGGGVGCGVGGVGGSASVVGSMKRAIHAVSRTTNRSQLRVLLDFGSAGSGGIRVQLRSGRSRRSRRRGRKGGMWGWRRIWGWEVQGRRKVSREGKGDKACRHKYLERGEMRVPTAEGGGGAQAR